MAMLGAGGAATGGPTLWMTIAARDRTGRAFDQVRSKVDKLGATAITTMGRVGSLATSFATLGKVTGMLTDAQARAIGVFGMVINTFAIVANVVRALTAVEWGHVAALTWKVALMTLGVGVAIAAAAALAVLAMQTQAAADAQKNLNFEMERGIATERKRTAHKNLVYRGEHLEAIG